MPTQSATGRRVSPRDLSPEQRAAYERVKAKADADLKTGLLGPPVEKLDLDSENAAPFYFEMLVCVAELKAAREAAGMTLAQVAEKAGVSEEAMHQLETGQVTNPAWKTLGMYAVAVGRKLTLTATA